MRRQQKPFLFRVLFFFLVVLLLFLGEGESESEREGEIDDDDDDDDDFLANEFFLCRSSTIEKTAETNVECVGYLKGVNRLLSTEQWWWRRRRRRQQQQGQRRQWRRQHRRRRSLSYSVVPDDVALPEDVASRMTRARCSGSNLLAATESAIDVDGSLDGFALQPHCMEGVALSLLPTAAANGGCSLLRSNARRFCLSDLIFDARPCLRSLSPSSFSSSAAATAAAATAIATFRPSSSSLDSGSSATNLTFFCSDGGSHLLRFEPYAWNATLVLRRPRLENVRCFDGKGRGWVSFELVAGDGADVRDFGGRVTVRHLRDPAAAAAAAAATLATSTSGLLPFFSFSSFSKNCCDDDDWRRALGPQVMKRLSMMGGGEGGEGGRGTFRWRKRRRRRMHRHSFESRGEGEAEAAAAAATKTKTACRLDRALAMTGFLATGVLLACLLIVAFHSTSRPRTFRSRRGSSSDDDDDDDDESAMSSTDRRQGGPPRPRRPRGRSGRRFDAAPRRFATGEPDSAPSRANVPEECIPSGRPISPPFR